MTPLHFGSDGRTAVVKTLLALGAAVDCVTNYLGYTALHKAVIGQHVDIVKYLLANSSNPNIRSKVRQYPGCFSDVGNNDFNLLSAKLTLSVS